MKLLNKCTIQIRFICLVDEDFIRKQYVEGRSGGYFERTTQNLPQLYGKKILGWGYIRASTGIGHNFVLVEKKDEIYGDWYWFITKNSAIYSNPRMPEPFHFELAEELEKEINLFGAMHIYVTNVELYNEKTVIEFISEFIEN